jgi:hypothetical protein
MTFSVCGQSFIYDQQSATNQAGGGGAPIQLNQPMGQSFTPTLDSIDFVQLEFAVAGISNQLGATIYVNLWSDSISNGTLLSSTYPIFIPDNAFNLVTNFTFSTPVSLTPGTVYYLQPYQELGGDHRMTVIDSQIYNYPRGTAYFQGAPDLNNSDLWFREGVLDVPEPSAAALALIGSGVFIYARHKRPIS